MVKKNDKAFNSKYFTQKTLRGDKTWTYTAIQFYEVHDGSDTEYVE